MTADVDVVSNVAYPHYKRSSDEAALNDYDIAVLWRVPADFNGFDESSALVFRYKTTTTGATDNKLDLILQERGSAAVSTQSALVSSTADTWASVTVDDTETILAGLSAGDLLMVRIRLYAKSDNSAFAGEVALKYDQKMD